jgi:hypothetical protein
MSMWAIRTLVLNISVRVSRGRPLLGSGLLPEAPGVRYMRA